MGLVTSRLAALFWVAQDGQGEIPLRIDVPSANVVPGRAMSTSQEVVRAGRVERPTYALSEHRSNQLSYARPCVTAPQATVVSD